MPGVAFVLHGAHLDTLARLTLPLTNLNNSLSQHDCYSTLRRIQALHSPTTTPLTAWLSGLHTITVYTQKKAAAKVYKLLLSNQAQLGITVGPVKQCITLGIQSRAELTDALRLAFTTGLQTRGWHKLSESRLLSSNPYNINNTFNITTTTTCASITVAVEPVSSSSIIVLIKPEIVTFRHPFACTTSISNVSYSPTPTNTSTGTIISPLIGTRCTLLPNLLPALIDGIDEDETQQHDEQQHKDLIKQWNVLSLGLFNPSTSIPMHSPSSHLLVKVRLTDDPDAPTISVPASCILSSSGLDVTDSYSLKKNHRIAQLLARLQTELPQAAAGIFSLPSTTSTSSCDGGETFAVDDGQQQSAVMVVEKICVWNYEKEEENGGERDRLISKPSPFMPGFQSADKILNQPSLFSSIMSLLGPTIDLNADVVGDGTANTATTTADALAVTKPRVTAGPQLKGFIAKLREHEEEVNQILGAAADRGTAAGKKAVVAFNGLPTSGTRSSIKTPAFVSKRGAFSLSPGNIIAAKKGLLTSSTNKKKKAKLASTGTPLPTTTTTTTTTAAAAAKPKKPATVEIDPASLNIPQLVQSDKLSTLTIPQLKAYLKSVKKPVGGKKSDLEERVKQHVNAML